MRSLSYSAPTTTESVDPDVAALDWSHFETKDRHIFLYFSQLSRLQFWHRQPLASQAPKPENWPPQSPLVVASMTANQARHALATDSRSRDIKPRTPQVKTEIADSVAFN